MDERPGITNLVPQSERTKEQQREVARMGGKASGVARRAKKNLAERLRILEEELIKNSRTGEERERADVIALQVMQKAAQGDLKAIRLYAELTGQLVQKVEVAPPTIEVLDLGIAEETQDE